MSKKTIRITESELKNIISNILNEIESGTWNNGSWVEDKPKTPNYDKGFSKYPCVTKQGWQGYDLNKDGVIEMLTPALAQTGISKQYFANGTMKLIDGKGGVKETTYSCSGDKVIDKMQNQKFATYSNTPFVKKGSLEYIPKQTKDTPPQKWITNLQQALINKKFLNIRKPTGNYGQWTHNAVLLATKNMNSGQETNQANGITKEMYNMIVTGKYQ
jgi:hypothetical protein